MLAGLFGREAETRHTWSSIDWFEEPGSQTYAGMKVSATTSTQLLAVYGCVRFICDSIATLPVDVYRRTATGQEDAPKPLWLREPTPELDFTAWCTQILSSLLLEGNAYFVVARDAEARIVGLPPLDPCKVEPMFDRGRRVYRIDGQPRPDLEVAHIPGWMMPGADKGVSPVEAARQSIGLGLASLQFGSQFFDGDGNMPGVIESPGDMPPDKVTELAKRWKRNRSRQGKGLPGVLTNGATWKPTGVTNEQAQFLATRQYTAAEIAGQMFLVDPSELGIPVAGTSLTYANLEQRSIRRVQVTFAPWIVRIEAALSRLLAAPRYVKLNTNAYLRADLLTRYQAYQIGIGSKFLVPNEPRSLEDLPPLDGGDVVVEAAPAPPPVPKDGSNAA